MSDQTKKRPISRAVPDPTALKALVHPARLRMLGILRIDGPTTATILAKRLGLNSGATSYHLRQLAQHGFIEAADDLGDKRDRWWRAAHEATTFETSEQSGDDLEAGLAMTQAVLSQHAQQMQRAHEEYRDLPVEWRKASTTSDLTVALSAKAAEELVEKIVALLWEAKAAAPAPGEKLAPGTRHFSILLNAFPFPGFTGVAPKEPEE